MKLYKYMSWRPLKKNGELDENCYVRKNLLNLELYFSSATSFNDPFDVCPYLNIKCSYDELLNKGIQIIMDTDKLPYVQARKKTIAVIKHHMLEKREVRLERAKLIQKYFDTIGVCCFTENPPSSTLMWAHYADSHHGICLEFNYSTVMTMFSHKIPYVFGPIKVEYSSNLPEYNLFKMTTDDIFSVISTKSADWNYEKEYRALASEFIGAVKFNPLLLSGIIAGCKMPDKEFEELQRTISILSVKPQLFRAQKNEREFGFDLIKV